MAEASDERVACPHCAKRYRWKPELSGRKVVCKCGQKMRLPTSAQGEAEAIGPPPNANDASTYDLDANDESGASRAGAAGIAAVHGVDKTGAPDEAGGAGEGRCPSCNQPVKPNAVICVQCGFNLKSGQQIETDVAEAADDAVIVDAGDDAAEADDSGSEKIKLLAALVAFTLGVGLMLWYLLL